MCAPKNGQPVSRIPLKQAISNSPPATALSTRSHGGPLRTCRPAPRSPPRPRARQQRGKRPTPWSFAVLGSAADAWSRLPRTTGAMYLFRRVARGSDSPRPSGDRSRCHVQSLRRAQDRGAAVAEQLLALAGAARECYSVASSRCGRAPTRWPDLSALAMPDNPRCACSPLTRPTGDRDDSHSFNLRLPVDRDHEFGPTIGARMRACATAQACA